MKPNYQTGSELSFISLQNPGVYNIYSCFNALLSSILYHLPVIPLLKLYYLNDLLLHATPRARNSTATCTRNLRWQRRTRLIDARRRRQDPGPEEIGAEGCRCGTTALHGAETVVFIVGAVVRHCWRS